MFNASTPPARQNQNGVSRTKGKADYYPPHGSVRDYIYYTLLLNVSRACAAGQWKFFSKLRQKWAGELYLSFQSLAEVVVVVAGIIVNT